MHKDPVPKEINLDLNQDLSAKFNRRATQGRNSMNEKYSTNRDSDEEASLYRNDHHLNIAEEPEIQLETECSPKMAPQFKNKSLESTITLDKENQFY